MAQTIATIALIICIIVLQHLYNWAVRKMWDKLEEDGFGLYLASTVFAIVITYFLFGTLLVINK